MKSFFIRILYIILFHKINKNVFFINEISIGKIFKSVFDPLTCDKITEK